MRTVLTRIGVAVATAAALVGCSNGGSGKPEQPEGTVAAQVCGGFAKDSTAALKALMGSERFTEDLSRPGKALKYLREFVRTGLQDPGRPQGYTYCWLLPAGQGIADEDLAVDVRGVAGKAPRRDPGLGATWFASGELAYATESHGKVFFACRLKTTDRPAVIETAVRAPAGRDDSDLRRRTQMITLANAAARHISKELGCVDDKLAPGTPTPVAGS
ncbi:hypothetical protein ACFYU9_06365 [Streptomyces sp. NPDC004327]|uniref:hypothetical protein n=1 Tax=Streptomyces sp. NPDC004327 TaxID=3364699 RepID=UPI003680BE53